MGEIESWYHLCTRNDISSTQPSPCALSFSCDYKYTYRYTYTHKLTDYMEDDCGNLQYFLNK